MRYKLLLSFLLFGFIAIGQSDDSKIIIDYRDGSVFIGHLIEENSRTLRLLTSTGDTLNVVKDMIKRRIDAKDYIITGRGKYHKTSGKFLSFDMGIHPANSPWVSTSLIYGLRFKPNISLGVGLSNTVAASEAFGLWLDHQFWQPFIYGKYYLNAKKFRWFADTKLGWGFPQVGNFWNDHNGGIYLNPGIGVEIANRKKVKWQFRLSQNLQHTSGFQRNFDGFNMPYEVDYNILYNRTTFSFGLIF